MLLLCLIWTYLDVFKSVDVLFYPLFHWAGEVGGIDPYLQQQSGEVVAGGQRGYTHLPLEAVNYKQSTTGQLHHQRPRLMMLVQQHLNICLCGMKNVSCSFSYLVNKDNSHTWLKMST